MSTIYQDPTKPIPDRVADLLDRMTIEEKTAQLGAIWFNAFLGDDGFDDDRAAELLVNGIGQITRIGASTALRPEESAAIVNQLQRIAIETTRLGIPIVIHEEAVAGYSARGATVFPQAIGLAATAPSAIKTSTAAAPAARPNAAVAKTDDPRPMSQAPVRTSALAGGRSSE